MHASVILQLVCLRLTVTVPDLTLHSRGRVLSYVGIIPSFSQRELIGPAFIYSFMFNWCRDLDFVAWSVAIQTPLSLALCCGGIAMIFDCV